MYLCLPARLVTLVAFRVLAELTGPKVSAEAGGPTLPGVSPRVGLLEVGGVLLLKPGPNIDVFARLKSRLGCILEPRGIPLGNPEVEVGCSELGTAVGPDWVDGGPPDEIDGPETSALSEPPNLKPGSPKMGYSSSRIPRPGVQEGTSGGEITVPVDEVEDDPGICASSLNLLATSTLVLLVSKSCSSLLLRPDSLCPRTSSYGLVS